MKSLCKKPIKMDEIVHYFNKKIAAAFIKK
jgi:hypothetical protein